MDDYNRQVRAHNRKSETHNRRAIADFNRQLRAGSSEPPASAADPTARAAATSSDYSNQADAQRAADNRDADGDGTFCESLSWACLGPVVVETPSHSPPDNGPA